MPKPKLVECASVPCHLTEDQARHVDDLVKNLPVSHQIERKLVACDHTVDQTEHTDVSYISTVVVDPDKDIVLPEGVWPLSISGGAGGDFNASTHRQTIVPPLGTNSHSRSFWTFFATHPPGFVITVVD